MKKTFTKKDLELAGSAIEKDSQIIYDAANNMFPAQIVDNVKHTLRFKIAVAEWIHQNKIKKVV